MVSLSPGSVSMYIAILPCLPSYLHPSLHSIIHLSLFFSSSFLVLHLLFIYILCSENYAIFYLFILLVGVSLLYICFLPIFLLCLPSLLHFCALISLSSLFTYIVPLVPFFIFWWWVRHACRLFNPSYSYQT
jgi:hypothetical protein